MAPPSATQPAIAGSVFNGRMGNAATPGGNVSCKPALNKAVEAYAPPITLRSSRLPLPIADRTAVLACEDGVLVPRQRNLTASLWGLFVHSTPLHMRLTSVSPTLLLLTSAV